MRQLESRGFTLIAGQLMPVVAAAFLLIEAVAFAQEPFDVLERLPNFETNGPSEFLPIAVGPSHVVLMAANSDLGLFQKATGSSSARLIQRVSTRAFFAHPPGPVDRLTDPDILFDPAAQRFFMAIADTTTGRQQLIIAVSKSATPSTLTAEDWHVYRLERNEPPDIAIADYDHLAIAGDRLLVSWDRTRETATERLGAGVTIRIFDKRLFMEGVADLDPVDLLIPVELSYRARPALVPRLQDRSTDRVFYDLWSSPGDMKWTIGAVSGLPSNPVFTMREVQSPFTPLENRLQSPQPGDAPPLSLRRLAANPTYRDGRLWVFEWFGGAVDGTVTAIYWMELDVRSWPDATTVLQSGVYRESDAWLSSPAGIVDGSGNLVLAFTRSGSVHLPANAVTGRMVTDPIGTLRSARLLQQGSRPWQFSGFPLSIMAGTAIDPSDGSVWISGATPRSIKPPSNDSALITIARLRPRSMGDPQFFSQPSNVVGNLGDSPLLSTAATTGASFLWQRNGIALAGTSAVLILSDLQPAAAGLYRAVATTAGGSTVSTTAIVGLKSEAKVIGSGDEISPDVPHPNGNTFDQVLLTGIAEAITADHAEGQVTRTSFIDLDDDIVQVEFSGPGTLTLVLDESSDPAPPLNYNQPAVSYMKGHAGIVITGATEQTNVSVFTVGRATANDNTGRYNILLAPSETNNPANNGSPLFVGHEATDYDGIADIAFIAISSENGKFGGIRTSNAHYFAENGLTGIYAPGVALHGPLFIGDLSAYDAAEPAIVVGSVADARITGGSLAQQNGAAVQVSGLTQLKFTAGGDSHGTSLPAQTNQAILRDLAGIDVTSQIVVNPAP